MWQEKEASETSVYDIFTIFRGKKYCWDSKVTIFQNYRIINIDNYLHPHD